MIAALTAKDYEKALKLAGARLQKNYVDLDAHFVSYAANRELKKVKESEFHSNVLRRLVQSIMGTGDGKSPETAFTVIAVAEEYALLNMMGFKPGSQALVLDKGHRYDRMSVVNLKTNEKTDLYFNVDKPLNWLGQSRRKP
jgi:Domain of unknown function (DUF4919)